MKTTGLLVAALLAISASQSFSQEVCNQSYLACLNRCTTKMPTVPTQDLCMQDCQRSNNSCSAKYFSAPVRSPHYAADATVTDEALAQGDQPVAEPRFQAADEPAEAAPQPARRQMAHAASQAARPPQASAQLRYCAPLPLPSRRKPSLVMTGSSVARNSTAPSALW